MKLTLPVQFSEDKLFSEEAITFELEKDEFVEQCLTLCMLWKHNKEVMEDFARTEAHARCKPDWDRSGNFVVFLVALDTRTLYIRIENLDSAESIETEFFGPKELKSIS